MLVARVRIYSVSSFVGFGGKFAEPASVILRKLTQMPESPFVCDIGNFHRGFMISTQIITRTIQSPRFHVMRRRQAKTFGKSVMQSPLACSGNSTKIADRENFLRLIIDRCERRL